MQTFYNSDGEQIRLGRELGRGGEGSVFELLDETGTVAKIYHEPIEPDKAEKLRQMVQLKSAKLLKLAAWVTDTLHHAPGGKTAGFLMPRVTSATAIHELYNPRSRRQHFPDADWRFLIAAAANLARAFSVVHAHDHAIGDVNHGNVVIARDATVRLIDCDSYHLNAPDRSFLCEVGVSTHTPPELQGSSLRDVARTANHDRFGLAVLIFQLLFMGRHPFSGAFAGAGENTLENSIKERRFAFGDDAESRQMKQPPGTLPLAAVSPQIAELFKRAFLTIENRPTAREWIEALDAMRENLRECAANTGHYYFKDLAKCPWCALEARTGVLFFPARFTGEFDVDGELDLYTLGQLIDAIKPPDVPQNLTIKPQHQLQSNVTLPASPRIQQALANYNVGLTAYLGILGLAIVLLIAFVGYSFLFYVFQLAFGGFWICWGIIKTLSKNAAEQTRLQLDAANQKWQEFELQSSKKAVLAGFDQKRDELKTCIKTYSELPKQKDARLKERESERRQKHLEFYLKSFPLEKAGIAGLNGERLETLEANQINTAADITTAAFGAIPQFSFFHRRKLFEWRAELEKQFVFEPTDKMKRDELQTIENEIAQVRLQLEARMKSGLPELQRIVEQTNRRNQDLSEQSATLQIALRQAESDSKRIADLQKNAIIWTICVAGASLAVGIPIRSVIYDQPNSSRITAPSVSGGRGAGVGGGSAANNSAGAGTAPKAVELTKEWGKAGELYQIGEKHFTSGEYDEAVAVFRKAARLRPDIAQIHKRLAEVLHVLDRHRESLKSYQKVVEIDPQNSDAHHMSGVIYQKLNRPQEAIAAFRKAVETNPSAATSNYELGAMLRKAKKPDEAREFLHAAIKSNPKFAEAHYELALSYLDTNDETEAWGEYNTLYSLDYKLAEQLYKKLSQLDGDGQVSGANYDAPPPPAPVPPPARR